MLSSLPGTRTASPNTPRAWAEEAVRLMKEEGYGVGEGILGTDLANHFDLATRSLYLRDGLAYAIDVGWLLRGKFDDSVSLTQLGFDLS